MKMRISQLTLAAVVLCAVATVTVGDALQQKLTVKRADPSPQDLVHLEVNAKFEQRLAAIILPKVELAGASFEEAARLLTTLSSSQVSPSNAGVHVLATGLGGAKTQSVTIQLRQVSLLLAVKLIAPLGGGKYVLQPESNAVLLVSQGYGFPERVYPLPSELMPGGRWAVHDGEDIKGWFQDRGASFPQGSSVVYESTSKQIRVKTSVEAHAMLAHLLSTMR